jgi:hypothetical protein
VGGGFAGAGGGSGAGAPGAGAPGIAGADAGAVAVAAGLADWDADGAVVFREFAGGVDPAPGPAQSTVVTLGGEEEPVAQRQPGPAGGALGAVRAAPAAGGGVDVDELVRRLYDPLSAQIKAELRLDRERAGFLTDLRH